MLRPKDHESSEQVTCVWNAELPKAEQSARDIPVLTGMQSSQSSGLG